MRQWGVFGQAARGGMNRSQPYTATIPANRTRFQVLATLAISDGSSLHREPLATRRRVPPLTSSGGL